MSKKKFEDDVLVDPIEAKIQTIRSSKMPEAQKLKCIDDLLPKEKVEVSGIPFNVYAKMKNIPKTLHAAMQTYPKAKNVSLATFEKWDEIFTDF
jgi:hypothetical protein